MNPKDLSVEQELRLQLAIKEAETLEREQLLKVLAGMLRMSVIKTNYLNELTHATTALATEVMMLKGGFNADDPLSRVSAAFALLNTLGVKTHDLSDD